MAEGSKLVLTFSNASGNNTTISFNYADPSVSSAAVKALANGIVANGVIYDNVPTETKSAKMVITTETEYDLSA